MQEKINVLNRIYSAKISEKEFVNPETQQSIKYNVLELGCLLMVLIKFLNLNCRINQMLNS